MAQEETEVPSEETGACELVSPAAQKKLDEKDKKIEDMQKQINEIKLQIKK